MFYDLYLRLCEEKKISPTKAAIEIGISKATPTTWKKRGLTPQGETLNKIAAYFGVTTDLLLGKEQKEAPTDYGRRKIGDDDIKFALFGTREIDDDVLDRVKQFAKFAQENEKNK